MAVLKPVFTPVAAPKGKRVHATSLAAPSETACGRSFRGGWRVASSESREPMWKVVRQLVTCPRCKLAMVFDCRPRRRRRRRAR